MADLNLTTVELVSTLREAPSNGPLVSQDYNDSQTEVLADLASLSGFLNDILIPMLNGLSLSIQPNPQVVPQGIEGRFIFGDTTDTSTLFFDALDNSPNTIADSFRILNGIVQATNTQIQNLNVEVTALQTQLSSSNQNDVSQALQNFASALQTLQAQVASIFQQLQGIIVKFEVGGVLNDVQNKLNLIAGPGVAIAATPSSGDVTISATTLKTDGTTNSTQSVLNLQAGASITLTETGGTVRIDSASATGILLETNGTPNGDQVLLNLKSGTGITVTDDGVGGVTVAASGSNLLGRTVVSTSSYSTVPGDVDKVLDVQTTSNTAITLNSFKGFIENNSVYAVTVARSSGTINGKFFIILSPGKGTTIGDDGTNATATPDGSSVQTSADLFPKDPAYVSIRDDFNSAGASSGSYGELGWNLQQNSGGPATQVTAVGGMFGAADGSLGSIGAIAITNSGTPKAGNYLVLSNNLLSNLGDSAIPLLDYPGWKATFVFGFQPPTEGSGFSTYAPLAQKRMYVGFAQYPGWNTGNDRPGIFCGIRYDTDVGSVYTVAGSTSSNWTAPNEVVTQTSTGATAQLAGNLAFGATSMSIWNLSGTPDNSHTWVGATSGGVFTPTGTPILQAVTTVSGSGITAPTGATWSGGIFSFTFASFASPQDVAVGRLLTTSGYSPSGFNVTNAAILSVDYVNKIITVAGSNPGGPSTAIGNGTITEPPINDTTFNFECVVNPQSVTGSSSRIINAQGSVFNTGVTPTLGAMHRLDMICTVAGQVQMSLDGSGPITLTMPHMSCQSTVGTSVYSVKGGQATISVAGGSGFASGDNCSAGQKITISGATSPDTFFNGSFVVRGTAANGPYIFFPISHADTAQTNFNTNPTVTGYPPLNPFIGFANDSGANVEINSTAFVIDFYGLVYSAGANGSTFNPTKPRYF